MKKTVLITGSTSGIGLATAREFAAHDYQLILTGRREDRLEQLQEELTNNFPVEVQTLCFDVRNFDECEKAISSITAPIDILINNAGLARGLD